MFRTYERVRNNLVMNNTLTYISISDKMIYDNQFFYHIALSSVNLSECEIISENSFMGCQSLENIDFPDSLIEIKDQAFCKCINLKSIKFPKNLVEISDRTFKACHQLSSITFNDKLKYIGVEAFHRCYNLTELYFPKSLEYIDSWAFKECYNLSSVHIPKTCKLGTETFGNCIDIEIHEY